MFKKKEDYTDVFRGIWTHALSVSKILAMALFTKNVFFYLYVYSIFQLCLHSFYHVNQAYWAIQFGINKVLCYLTREEVGFQLSLRDSLTGDITVSLVFVFLRCLAAFHY